MSLLPWEPDTNCETHEYRSATGEVIRFVTRTDATSRMMPPVTLTTVKVPQHMGAHFRYARHDERLVSLPVVLPGPTDGRDELRRWARVLDPAAGEGTLTVVQGRHAGRQLVCCYEAGLETYAEEFPMLGLTELAFHAADPYWQDSVENQVVATLDNTTHTWFPMLPLILGASDAFASVVANNTGDVDAWPIITVNGPGEELSIINETTGMRWDFDGVIAAGSQLVVDTRPGMKSVRLNGVNAFGRLAQDSSLWPIVRGPNRVTIDFANITTATIVRFAWRKKWLAA